MMNLTGFLVGALILAVPATAREDNLISFIEREMLEATFNSGRAQILAAELTPECKQIALTNLEDVKASTMTCDGAYEVMADVGTIFDQAFNSTSDFVTDLNTLFNGIPGCFEDYSWYNAIGMVTCLIGQIRPVMNASVHVNNFTDYYMDTVNKMKELASCLRSNKATTDNSVTKIVQAASLCARR